MDVFHPLVADELAEHLAGPADAGAAGDVGYHDVLVLQSFDELGEMVEVQVAAGLGLGLVLAVEESDLGDEDLGVDDVGVFEDLARQCRRGMSPADLDAVLIRRFLASALLPRRAHVLGLELRGR
jgi:hypothetical protein